MTHRIGFDYPGANKMILRNKQMSFKLGTDIFSYIQTVSKWKFCRLVLKQIKLTARGTRETFVQTLSGDTKVEFFSDTQTAFATRYGR